MKRVCTSIGKKSVSEVLEQAKRVAPVSDVIEVRLDMLGEIDLPLLTSTIQTPLLMTNRPKWEGGEYSGDERTRITFLEEAMGLGCDYVDIELLAPEESRHRLLEETKSTNTDLIVSWHNFERTPASPDLSKILEQMAEAGGDIGKIITMAHDYHDVLRVLQLQEDAARLDFPLIAFCMGRAGTISRVATLELGGYMTYCAADEGDAVAPGQLSVFTLRQIYKRMRNQ